MAIIWRILVVEDDAGLANQIKQAAEDGKWVDDPDKIVVEISTKFQEASAMLDRFRFDIVILDLHDDSIALPEEDENLAGLKIFEKIKLLKFLPVIFYTALQEKVREVQSPFVRVVEKTQGVRGIKTEFEKVLKTKLPSLLRHIADQQRIYMWDFIHANRKHFEKPNQHFDLTYLLARRLALSLRGPMIRKFAANMDGPIPLKDRDVHPMELYVALPVHSAPLAGDILQITKPNPETKQDQMFWYIILTPSCDLEHDKTECVLLARCFLLTDQHEYKKWKSDNNTKQLEKLIGDNRDGQRDRYKFLPGTFLLPDLVVDFQHLESIAVADLAKYQPIASLDSPYAESLLARFSRYYGRLGTPDLDRTIVLSRLESTSVRAPAPDAEQPPPHSALGAG